MFLKTCSTVSTRFLWTVLGDQERSPCAIHVKMSMGYHWTAQYDHYAVSKGSVRRCSYICSMRSLAECVNTPSAFQVRFYFRARALNLRFALVVSCVSCFRSPDGSQGEKVSKPARRRLPPNGRPDHGHMDRCTVREFCTKACSFEMLRWLDGA